MISTRQRFVHHMFSALCIRKIYWGGTLLLFFIFFPVGRICAPQSLPLLVSLQNKRPDITIIRPFPSLNPDVGANIGLRRFRFGLQVYKNNVIQCTKICLIGFLTSLLLVVPISFFAYATGVQLYVYGVRAFLLTTLPHGLIEIPILLLVAAGSMQTGMSWMLTPWRQKMKSFGANTLNIGIIWLTAVILLFPTAMIEAFGRPWLHTLFLT